MSVENALFGSAQVEDEKERRKARNAQLINAVKTMAESYGSRVRNPNNLTQSEKGREAAMKLKQLGVLGLGDLGIYDVRDGNRGTIPLTFTTETGHCEQTRLGFTERKYAELYAKTLRREGVCRPDISERQRSYR